MNEKPDTPWGLVLILRDSYHGDGRLDTDEVPLPLNESRRRPEVQSVCCLGAASSHPKLTYGSCTPFHGADAARTPTSIILQSSVYAANGDSTMCESLLPGNTL